jgi:hypothetical protein
MRPSPSTLKGGATILRTFVNGQARQRGGAWNTVAARSFATETGKSDRKKSDRGNDENKQDSQKAGPGFFETLRKRFSEQWNQKAQEDPKLQEAMKTMDVAKQDAEAAARRAMEVIYPCHFGRKNSKCPECLTCIFVFFNVF